MIPMINPMSNDADVLIVSHPINRDLYYKITNLLRSKTTASENCILILTTYGGDPHAGFRIARCLRHHYSKLRIVIPSYCKSAGTLIAIAADELVVGNTGELGPLDVQVINPNEMQSRTSGLDIQQALVAIDQHATGIFFKHLQALKMQVGLSTRLAAEIATNLAIGQTEPLYAQIDPLRIGELQRAMQIALSYGATLDGYARNLKAGALQLLASDYPSHSYVIDRKEATELFQRVFKPSEMEISICDQYHDKLQNQNNLVELVKNQLPQQIGEQNEIESTTHSEYNGANAEDSTTNGTDTKPTNRKKPRSRRTDGKIKPTHA